MLQIITTGRAGVEERGGGEEGGAGESIRPSHKIYCFLIDPSLVIGLSEINHTSCGSHCSRKVGEEEQHVWLCVCLLAGR